MAKGGTEAIERLHHRDFPADAIQLLQSVNQHQKEDIRHCFLVSPEVATRLLKANGKSCRQRRQTEATPGVLFGSIQPS